jgi:formate hydrogenlyase subunit 6/NADH:ubiquinone oxidoreductase subunit I
MERVSSSYWRNISDSVQTLLGGLKLTFRHLVKARKTQPIVSITNKNYFAEREGIATIQYPYEMQPVPDNGRYRLHNEIDDCIVCDKCAKICPVDCIDIEPIRAVEEIGKTSDGTPKRIYAAKFDIDMGKCCFCGLCTTVCPTECLTMTKVFDFSVTNMREHNFEFCEMTETDITEKKKVFEEHQKSKAASQAQPIIAEQNTEMAKPAVKPVFKPKIKPPTPPATST